MALKYYLYTTLYNNTLVDRSDTSFAPLPPNTGEIYIDFLIPNTQPLYYYRESGAAIIFNDEATINAYLEATAPSPLPDDPIVQEQFTGYTATTDVQLTGVENNIVYLSGQTDTKLNIVDFNNFSGTTLPANYYNKVEINSYTGTTATLINTKAPLNNPALTGTPTAPTATINTSTTQLATTAFVTGQAANVNPTMSGSVAIGTSLRYARQDHVHPNDNSKVNVSGGSTICGSLTATTTLYMMNPSTGGTLSDYYVRWNPDTGEFRTIPPTSDQRLYCYVDKTATESNSTTTNVQYLNKSWTLSAGHYESEFNAIFGNTASNRCAVVCFVVDGNVVGSCNLMKTNASTVQTTAYVTQNSNLSGGTHTVEMVYHQLGGGTSQIHYGAMRIQRISDCI